MPKNPQQGNVAIILLVVALLGAVGFGAFYYGKNTKSSSDSPIDPGFFKNPGRSTPTPTLDETANWKTYTHEALSFKYPSDWSAATSDYLNSIKVVDKDKTVCITISEGQWPFGFGGDINIKQESLALRIGDREYQTEETVVDEKDMYVNIKLDTSKDHTVTFGTIAICDINGTLQDYYRGKNTILTILSTLKFIQ